QPVYVRSNPAEQTSTTTENKTETTTTANVDTTTGEMLPANIRPIDSTNVKTLVPTQTSDESTESILPKPVPLPLNQTSLKTEKPENAETNVNLPKADLRFLPNLSEMKTGEKMKIAVMINSAAPFRSAVLGL